MTIQERIETKKRQIKLLQAELKYLLAQQEHRQHKKPLTPQS